VPELLGPITADQVSDLAIDYLSHPEKLAEISQTLRQLRGPAGAADKMASLILETVDYSVESAFLAERSLKRPSESTDQS
jgi:lipid-A-disaccharide synthase